MGGDFETELKVERLDDDYDEHHCTVISEEEWKILMGLKETADKTMYQMYLSVLSENG